MTAELAPAPVCLVCGEVKIRRSSGRGFRCYTCSRENSKRWHCGGLRLFVSCLAPITFPRTPAQEAEAQRRADVYARRVGALVDVVGDAALDLPWPTLRIVGNVEPEGAGDAREDPYEVLCDECGTPMTNRTGWHDFCRTCKRTNRAAQRARARG